MEEKIYREYVKILGEELLPAMGCTEPIAIAYASAAAREILGCLPEKIEIAVSGNIVKNVKSVVVPHTGGLRGIAAAACAGVVCGRADKQLEVISQVSDEQVRELNKFLEKTPVSILLADTPYIFDIDVRLQGHGHTSRVRIVEYHTNIVLEEKDGRTLLV